MPEQGGVSGCDQARHPNGNVADVTISAASHEQIEMVTDPIVGRSWMDASRNEIGDKCDLEFGNPIGATPGGVNFNQQINGTNYMLQQEWSNAAGGCVQRTASSPTPAQSSRLAAPASRAASRHQSHQRKLHPRRHRGRSKRGS
jgi:hypothetical protein